MDKTSTGGTSSFGIKLSTSELTIYEIIACFFVKHTWRSFLGCWGILVLFAVLALILGYFRIEQVGFDDWLVLGTQAVDNLDKLRGAVDYVDVSETLQVAERLEDAGRFFQTQMVFKWTNAAEERDYLTPRNLQHICKLEGSLLNHPKYPLFCQASIFGANGTNTTCDPQRLSISVMFYPSEAKRNSCELLTQIEIDAVRDPLYTLLSTPNSALNPSQLGLKAMLQFMVGSSFVRTGNATSFRSNLLLGGPLNGYQTLVDSSRDPQFGEYEAFLLEVEASMFAILELQNRMFAPAYNLAPDGFAKIVREPVEDGTSVRWFNFALQNNQFRVLVNDDQLLAAASVIVVGALMYVHLGSMWFVSLGLFAILLSVPASAFWYSGVFGIKYFTQVHVIVIFIIIGIGTDDVFVFVDAWKQAAVNWRLLRGVESLEDALAKNYYGTGSAIAEMEVARVAYTWKRSMEAVLATSFTTAVAFLATAVSPIVPIAGFGYFAAMVVIANYILVLTMMPGMALIHSRFFSMRTTRQVCGCKPGPARSEREVLIGGQSKLADTPSPEDRLFRQGYLPLMTKWRKSFAVLGLVGMSVIFVVTIVFAVRLTTPVQEDSQFRPTHMFTGFDELFTSFTNGTAGADERFNFAKIDLVFGVTGINRTGFDFWVPGENRGEAIFNPRFDFSLPTSQALMLRACDMALEMPCELEPCSAALPAKVLFNPIFLDCWFREFRSYVNATLNTTTEDMCIAGTFNSSLKQWAELPAQRRLKNEVVGFENGTSLVRFVTLPLYTTMKSGRPVNEKRPVLQLVRAFAANVTSITNAEMDKPFFSSFDDTWMQTELSIVSGMVSGLQITFPICFVVLLMLTGNLLISIFAIISIGGVVCTVLGIIQLMGWALGIGEAIANVMVVGLAVDYTVHLGGAYNHAKDFGLVHREERFKFSVEAMGGTVFASAITTIASSVPLFAANLAFFYKMATLLSLTIGFSTLYTYFFFLPSLLFWGPEGDFADVYVWIGRMRGQTSRTPSDKHVEDQSKWTLSAQNPTHDSA